MLLFDVSWYVKHPEAQFERCFTQKTNTQTKHTFTFLRLTSANSHLSSLRSSPSIPGSLSLQLSADCRNYDLFPVHRNNRTQEEERVVTPSANAFISRCANVWYFPLHFHKLHTLEGYPSTQTHTLPRLTAINRRPPRVISTVNTSRIQRAEPPGT